MSPQQRREITVSCFGTVWHASQHGGHIAMMLLDHKHSKNIATRMEESAKEYLLSKNSVKLINDMQQYVQHVTEHLWKENNRLFVMAESRLQRISES